MAKNRYIIVKHVDPEEVKKGYAQTLYYNGYIGPHFIMMRDQAQEFTNKRTAKETMKYAVCKWICFRERDQGMDGSGEAGMREG